MGGVGLIAPPRPPPFPISMGNRRPHRIVGMRIDNRPQRIPRLLEAGRAGPQNRQCSVTSTAAKHHFGLRAHVMRAHVAQTLCHFERPDGEPFDPDS